MIRRRKDDQGNVELNVREQRFVESALQGKTYTQAALDAGFPEKRAGSAGYELAHKPHIQAAIRQRVREVTAADVEEVLGVLTAHLRGDIADLDDFYRADGTLDLKAAKRAGISRTVKKHKTRRAPIRNKQGEVVDYATITEVEMYCAYAAARTLADIMGIKQMPRTNDADRAHEKEMMAAAHAEVERLMGAGWSEAEARSIVIEAVPLASQWLQ